MAARTYNLNVYLNDSEYAEVKTAAAGQALSTFARDTLLKAIRKPPPPPPPPPPAVSQPFPTFQQHVVRFDIKLTPNNA
jgi:hypothetical protein